MRYLQILPPLIAAVALFGCSAPKNNDGPDEHARASEKQDLQPPCASWNGTACRPLIFSLLSEPQLFNGMHIQVNGYAIWGERGLVVYPSIDMACSQTDFTGVELDFGLDINQGAINSLSKNGVVPITVSGSFDSSMNGQADRYIGHIKDSKVINLNVLRSSLRVDPRKLEGAEKPVSLDYAVTLMPPACN